MSAPFVRRCAVVKDASRNGASLAVYCARNVYAAVDRHTPEARGLAKWIEENAAGFGLLDEAIPGAGDSAGFSRRRGVSEQVWGKIGSTWRRQKQDCRTWRMQPLVAGSARLPALVCPETANPSYTATT
jgi:hypothetical protein